MTNVIDVFTFISWILMRHAVISPLVLLSKTRNVRLRLTDWWYEQGIFLLVDELCEYNESLPWNSSNHYRYSIHLYILLHFSQSKFLSYRILQRYAQNYNRGATLKLWAAFLLNLREMTSLLESLISKYPTVYMEHDKLCCNIVSVRWSKCSSEGS